MNQRAKYLGQRLFSSKVILRTHTHFAQIALSGPLEWSVKQYASTESDDVADILYTGEGMDMNIKLNNTTPWIPGISEQH